MTIGLRITDNTNIVDLNDGSYFEVMEFDPGAAMIGALSVTGSIRLYIDGTKAQIQTELAALQKMLQAVVDVSGTGEGAQLYSGLDQKVYLSYRTDGTESYWDSELLRIGYRVDPDSIEILNFDCGGVTVYIDFERRNWWEGPLDQVPLSNHLSTNSEDWLRVNNPDVAYANTTISFVAATKKILDSASGSATATYGLNTFKTGDTIWITGSASNDGMYTVVTGGVAAEIVVNEALADEAAGALIVILGEINNYADVTGTDIIGDMPGITRLEMAPKITHFTGSIKYIWVGHGWHNGQSSFQHIYQGETVVSAPYYANASQAQYFAIAITNDRETEIASWPITSAQIQNASGRYYKLIARFYALDDALDGGYVRFRLNIKSGSITIWQSAWVKPELTPALNIRDLLVFQLPPSLPGLSDTGGLVLVLEAYQNSGADANADIDFIQLTPVDGFILVSCFDGIGTGNAIVIDGINDYVYRATLTGAGPDPTILKAPYGSITGNYIYLQPGRDQRLYFLHSFMDDYSEGPSAIRSQFDLKVYYRPRRLML